jgi:hypothetical protein
MCQIWHYRSETYSLKRLPHERFECRNLSFCGNAMKISERVVPGLDAFVLLCV